MSQPNLVWMIVKAALAIIACTPAFVAGCGGSNETPETGASPVGPGKQPALTEAGRPAQHVTQTGVPTSQAPQAATIQMRQIDGSFWFVDAEGEPFFSLGVNSVRSSAMAPLEAGGLHSSIRNFTDWGFNTLGAWSDSFPGSGYPYAVMLDLAPEVPIENKLDRVFSDDFTASVRRHAERIRRYRDDPLLLGYFLDNELPWWGDTGWRDDGKRTLLEKYGRATTKDANKDALVDFMRERYQTVDRFESIWNLGLTSFDDLAGPVPLVVRTRAQRADAHAWAGRVAMRYFDVTTSFVRSIDPDHLILGVRFAGEPIWEVADECGRVSDVISINHYSPAGDVDTLLLDNLYARTGKPILISEYSFRATRNRSGNPNTRGPEVTVATQEARAEHAARYAQQALSLPYIVGLHWFSWEDQPPQGRADGEDSNVGLLDIQGQPYRQLVEVHRRINAGAASIHADGRAGFPAGFKLALPVTYRAMAGGNLLPGIRPFVDFSRPVEFGAWAHTGYGGTSRATVAEGQLTLQVESGSGWGGGVSVVPNTGDLLSGGQAIDMLGYDLVEVFARASTDLRFSLYLTESGAGPPTEPPQDGLAGADGESYALPMLIGRGAWTVYRLPLSELEPRTNWGNQHGNRVLDLQAIAAVDLHVGGAQGAGELRIRQINFIRNPP